MVHWIYIQMAEKDNVEKSLYGNEKVKWTRIQTTDLQTKKLIPHSQDFLKYTNSRDLLPTSLISQLVTATVIWSTSCGFKCSQGQRFFFVLRDPNFLTEVCNPAVLLDSYIHFNVLSRHWPLSSPSNHRCCYLKEVNEKHMQASSQILAPLSIIS